MKPTLVILTVISLILSACAPAEKTLADRIQGTWKSTEGFSIEFHGDGTGFIPGVAGKIPDTSFNYSIVDESHVQLDLQGQMQTIGITISDDKLTWKDDLGEVEYTREEQE